jgi:hypothetical protein
MNQLVASKERVRRDSTVSVLGLVVFLAGVGLLLVTFKLAYDMFSVPPERALPLQGATIQVGVVGSTVAGLVLRVLLLIVMGLTGSLIANRGIHLYTESRSQIRTVEETVEKT